MIEAKILDWIDLGDSLPLIEVYSKRNFLRIFNLFRIMNKNKPESVLFVLFCKFFFFFQFLIIPLINTPESKKKNDSLIKIINYIKQVIFVQDLISNRKSYLLILSLSFIFCSFIFFLIIYLLFFSNKNLQNNYSIKILNFLNFFLQHLFLCFIINVFMLTTKCIDNNKHIYLDMKCWNTKHIALCFISLLYMLICIFYSILLSIYYNIIGGIKSIHLLASVNSNYKIILNILSLISYFIGYFIKYYTNEEQTYYNFCNKIMILFLSFTLLIIYYKYVYYYNFKVNFIIIYGWTFILWYSIALIFKHFLDITDIILFVFVGWFVLFFLVYILSKYQIEYYLTEANILEAKNIKEVEIFTYNLLQTASQNNIKSKTLLIGLLNSLQEFFSNNNELYDKFTKFENNKILIQKIGGKENPIFQVYNIIYLVYDYYINRSLIKDDILLLFCYFLTNHLKNVSYSFYLCSKIKITHHKLSFLKYTLMEELKEYLMRKLKKNSSNKETIKYVEFGSVISYNALIDSFKLKIYDASTYQIDYFDILRNTTFSSKSTKNFLQLGEKIINLRKEILNLWNEIIKLNPFSDEYEKDYMLYLETIIQDEELAIKEEKKYNQIKLSKLSEKNNIYHSLFSKEQCSILLLGGNSLNCKILYTTANFPIIFNYQPKEILLMNIEDLIPYCLSSFHQELINNALKYSNISYIFNKKLNNTFLKSKTNGLYNIELYVKCLPNLSHGLIFIAIIEKLNDNKFLILLDHEFKINSMSDPLSFPHPHNLYSILSQNCSFDLNQNIVNHHIGILIPEILKQIKYENNRFSLCKNDIDLKGRLYPNINDFSNTETNVELILERIKQSGQLFTEEYLNCINNREILRRTTTKSLKRQTNLKEYNDLIDELNEKFNGKNYGIFYNLIMKSFLNGKFNYYRLYIINDILENNENEINFTKISINPKFDILRNKTNLQKISVESNLHQIQKQNDKNERVITLNIQEGDIMPLIEKNKTNLYNFQQKESKQSKNTKNELNDKNNYQEKNSHHSLSTNASIDSAVFNKLKSKILEKNSPIFIKYMKLITIIYFIITIIFVYFYNSSMKSRFRNTSDFINENYFFNTTKVLIGCIYLTALNFKFLKYKILLNEDCYQVNCSIAYITIFNNCLNAIQSSTTDLLYYNIDYKNILSKTKDLNIYVYSLKYSKIISINTPNLINYILTNGLRIIDNINEYINNENDTTFEVYEENILNSSFSFLHDYKIEDFRMNYKKKKLEQPKFNPNYLYYIINIIFYVIIVFIFIYFIFKIYLIEVYFLEKLIWFNTSNFENYIKYLSDLKKKLRSEPEEDEDDNMDYLKNDSNENNNQSESDIKKKKEDKKESTKTIMKKNFVDEKKKKSKKKKQQQGKLSKIHQQKVEKMNVMKRYFLIFNSLISIRLIIILIFVILYYILIDRIYVKKKKDFINLDNIMSEVYGIFNESSIKFSKLMNQTSYYLNYEINKEKYIKQLSEGIINNITIDLISYTKDDINLLNSTSYKLIIPNIEEMSIPNIGNCLNSLFKKNEKGLLNNPYSQLYKLYYGNICELLYNNNLTVYNNCILIWSAILKQGLEQTITQFSIEINSLLDQFKEINNGNLSIKDIYNYNGTLGKIEMFINFFFLDSFIKTRELFKDIMEDKIHDLNFVLNIFFVLIIILIPFLLILILIFIYYLHHNLTLFLNFIGIFPIQYLSEDKNFYRDTLKLEGDIFEP